MDKAPNILNISFSKALESAINAAIRLDDIQGQGFDALDSKVIGLQISPFNESLYCLINRREVALQHMLAGHPDSTLKLDITALLGLPLGECLQAEVTDGDRETGQAFIDALNQLEVDWEEHLSHYTGDLVAFKIGHGVRAILERKQQTKAYAGETLKEYLQFEINTLPAKHQVEHFIKNVQQLEQQVDDIAGRIANLSDKADN